MSVFSLPLAAAYSPGPAGIPAQARPIRDGAGRPYRFNSSTYSPFSFFR